MPLSAENTAEAHQEYIQAKVNPTLENMVTQVLLERPENPVPFMVQWLANQTNATPQLVVGEAETLRQEIIQLKMEVGELEAKIGPAAASALAAAIVEADEEGAEDDQLTGYEAAPVPEVVEGEADTAVSTASPQKKSRPGWQAPLLHEKVVLDEAKALAAAAAAKEAAALAAEEEAAARKASKEMKGPESRGPSKDKEQVGSLASLAVAAPATAAPATAAPASDAPASDAPATAAPATTEVPPATAVAAVAAPEVPPATAVDG